MIVAGALAVTGWQEHWLSAASSPGPRPTAATAATIRFTSDQGIVLTRPGALYQLAVADTSGRPLPGPAVHWRSDDPAQVSVSADGLVTAHVPVGSATITATVAGSPPLAAQALVAAPAPGTVLVPTQDIVSTAAGRVTLRRTPQTAAISPGNVLISDGRPGGGLLARVLSVSARASQVTAVTSPASLASAFEALSVQAMSAPATAAPRAVAQTTADLTAECKLAAGAGGSVSLQGPSVSVPATVQLSGVLNVPRPGVVQQFELAVQATLPITVRSGSATVSVSAAATASCELAVASIPVPTPIFFGPVEVSGEVDQAAGVEVALHGGAGLTIPGPALSDTVTADNGIEYTSAGGWSSVDHDGQSGITISPGPAPAAHATVSATMSPFVSVGFGVAGTLAGDELAGASLAFARAQGDYDLAIQPPFSYLAPGYAGPRWSTSLGLTGGPEIALNGNLATLLRWLGLTLPDKKWNLVDLTVPLQSSPSVTVTATPVGTNGNAITLSAALPASFNGDNLEFVEYPPRGGPGTVVARAVVSGGAATGPWNGAAPAPGTRVAALVFDHLFGAVGLPYASSLSAPLGATAWTSLTWTSTQVPVPADAATSPETGANVALGGIACPADGSCVAVGGYDSANMNGYGLIETLANGTWTASRAPLPGNAAAQQQAGLSGVSCPAPGNCVAVGYYTDDQGGTVQGLIETLADGTWTPAEGPAPTGAAAGVQLSAVACATAGSCAATGGLFQNGFSHAILATLAGGTWRAAAAPLLPGSASGNSALHDIACPAPGNCIAVGGYGVLDSGQGQGLIETLSNGAWTPTAAPLPAGASNDDVLLPSVACPAPGQCVAVGAYDLSVAGPGTRPLIEALSNGAWTATGPPPRPAGFIFAELDGVACPATGACVATGTYNDTPQGTIGATLPWTETLSQGAWTPNVAVPISGGPGGLGAVACPTLASCAAVVAYNHPWTAAIETGRP